MNNRSIKSYKLVIAELSENINKIENKLGKIAETIIKIESFVTDYTRMYEIKKYKLGVYVNLMETSTMLFINPILDLQLKYKIYGAGL